jgi:hypothetical protein
MKILSSVTSRIVALALVVGGGVFAASQAHASRTHVDFGVSLGIPIDHGRGYVGINLGGHDHYRYGHRYGYRHGYRGGYVPYYYRGRPYYHGGFHRHLPRHYTRVYVGDVMYYRSNDIFYRPYDDGYVIVDSPYTTTRVIERRVAVPAQEEVVVDPSREIGASSTTAPSAPSTSAVPSAPYPDQFQIVWLGDVQYQYDNGQFFKKTADGLVWTEAPFGATCKQLPPDAKSVWYQENEFWTVDGVFFRKTPDGYRVVQQPWANAPAAAAPAPGRQ